MRAMKIDAGRVVRRRDREVDRVGERRADAVEDGDLTGRLALREEPDRDVGDSVVVAVGVVDSDVREVAVAVAVVDREGRGVRRPVLDGDVDERVPFEAVGLRDVDRRALGVAARRTA